eukprot:1192548-Rhodomonas_salina.2
MAACGGQSGTTRGSEGAQRTLGDRSDLLQHRRIGRMAHTGQVVQHPPSRPDGRELQGTVVAGPVTLHHLQAAPSPLRAVDQTVHPSQSPAR